MIQGENRILQAFISSLITWALTTIGATVVFLISRIHLSQQKNILRFSLGFAAGVMMSASFWSLLVPGLEMATRSGWYGVKGQYSWVPAAIGFPLGAGFVHLCDKFLLPRFVGDELSVIAMRLTMKKKKDIGGKDMVISQPLQKLIDPGQTVENTAIDENGVDSLENDGVMLFSAQSSIIGNEDQEEKQRMRYKSWRRMMVLVIAVIVHNVPEGLALGVAFGAIGTSKNTFAKARNQAIGIGLQNIAEGLGVSVPLWGAGYSPVRSFCYGTISGATEPIFAIVGSLAVRVGIALLPYTLSFAAGAAIYAIVDAVLPEAYSVESGRVASWGCVVGFVILMCLDHGTRAIAT